MGLLNNLRKNLYGHAIGIAALGAVSLTSCAPTTSSNSHLPTEIYNQTKRTQAYRMNDVYKTLEEGKKKVPNYEKNKAVLERLGPYIKGHYTIIIPQKKKVFPLGYLDEINADHLREMWEAFKYFSPSTKLETFKELYVKGNINKTLSLFNMMHDNSPLYEEGGEIHHLYFIYPGGVIQLTSMDTVKDGKVPFNVVFAYKQGMKGLQDAYAEIINLSFNKQRNNVSLVYVDNHGLINSILAGISYIPYSALPGVSPLVPVAGGALSFLNNAIFNRWDLKQYLNVVGAYLKTDECKEDPENVMLQRDAVGKLLLNYDFGKNNYHYVVVNEKDNNVVIVSSPNPLYVEGDKLEGDNVVMTYSRRLGHKSLEEFLNKLIHSGIIAYSIHKYVKHQEHEIEDRIDELEKKINNVGKGTEENPPEQPVPNTPEPTPTQPKTPEPEPTPSKPPEQPTPYEPPTIPYPTKPHGVIGPGSTTTEEGPIMWLNELEEYYLNSGSGGKVKIRQHPSNKSIQRLYAEQRIKVMSVVYGEGKEEYVEEMMPVGGDSSYSYILDMLKG